MSGLASHGKVSFLTVLLGDVVSSSFVPVKIQYHDNLDIVKTSEAEEGQCGRGRLNKIDDST